MAIQFRSIGAGVVGTTSISMPMPTTHVAGDLLLMFVHTPNQAITTAPANGWALLSPSPVSTGTANTALGVRLTVYWKIAQSSSEAAQTVAVTSGTATNGNTVAYSGVNTTTPFDTTPTQAVQATSLANLSFPTLTTATDGAMIVNAVALDNDTASTTIVTSPVNASLTGVARRYGRTVSTATGGGICFIDGVKTSAGLISATTATVAAAARAYLTIALRPIVATTYPKELTASVLMSASSTRQASLSKSMSATVLMSGAMERTLIQPQTYPKELLATLSMSAQNSRLTAKNLSSTVNISATDTKAVQKTLQALTCVSASDTKSISKAMTAYVGISASDQKTIEKALYALSLITGSTQRELIELPDTYPKDLQGTVAISATATKTISKILTAQVGINATASKAISVSKSATVSITSTVDKTVSAIMNYEKVMSTTVSMSASATKEIAKALSTSVDMSASEQYILTQVQTYEKEMTAHVTIVSSLLTNEPKYIIIKGNNADIVLEYDNSNKEIKSTNEDVLIVGNTKTFIQPPFAPPNGTVFEFEDATSILEPQRDSSVSLQGVSQPNTFRGRTQ